MPYVGTHLRPPSSPRAYRHALGATEIIRHLGEGSPLLPGTILAPPAYRRAASNFENLFSFTPRRSVVLHFIYLPPPLYPYPQMVDMDGMKYSAATESTELLGHGSLA